MEKIIEKAWRDGFDSGLSCCGICTNTKENKLFEKWNTENNAAVSPTPTKEGLHTQGEWMTNDISRDRTAIEIITDKPNGQNSNGYIATIECDLYTVPGQARANADIICQAVNERKALLDSRAELLKKIYHAIDIRCFSETENVSMTAIREELVKFGANEKDLW